jgi:hypothetical protein
MEVPMPKPQNTDELCATLKAYFTELYEWQKRVNNRANKLEEKAGGQQDDDPPPPPPSLG